MALLYSWATKEYLLWNMTIGQLIMYHNIGIELKYPTPKETKKRSLLDMSKEEQKSAIAKAHEDWKRDRSDSREQENDDQKARYRELYGDV
jgi:hypothetical protein